MFKKLAAGLLAASLIAGPAFAQSATVGAGTPAPVGADVKAKASVKTDAKADVKANATDSKKVKKVKQIKKTKKINVSKGTADKNVHAN